MPVTKIIVDAILFDMDGTLVDSTDGVIGAWETFAETYPGLNVTEILNTAHGVRTVDNLRIHCGITDEEILEKEASRFEREIVNSSRKDGRRGIVLLPGVKEVMDELLPGSKLPKPWWAICTSATRDYAKSAVSMAGVPVPDVFVAAEDVTKGKPEPDPYLLGAQNCGVDPSRCIVVEDAPAGIRAGQAAGCKTLAVVTSHTRDQMAACKPDYLVQNLSSVKVKKIDRGIEVTIDTLE